MLHTFLYWLMEACDVFVWEAKAHRRLWVSFRPSVVELSTFRFSYVFSPKYQPSQSVYPRLRTINATSRAR